MWKLIPIVIIVWDFELSNMLHAIKYPYSFFSLVLIFCLRLQNYGYDMSNIVTFRLV